MIEIKKECEELESKNFNFIKEIRDLKLKIDQEKDNFRRNLYEKVQLYEAQIQKNELNKQEKIVKILK